MLFFWGVKFDMLSSVKSDEHFKLVQYLTPFFFCL
uniref:Uncharacterized protein n=1 Tax=Rhizophora mucronata TaxID=61149 RepID=A0A2P2PG00_RHIMU